MGDASRDGRVTPLSRPPGLCLNTASLPREPQLQYMAKERQLLRANR
jgi:hypothetical protein